MRECISMKSQFILLPMSTFCYQSIKMVTVLWDKYKFIKDFDQYPLITSVPSIVNCLWQAHIDWLNSWFSWWNCWSLLTIFFDCTLQVNTLYWITKIYKKNL